MGTPATEAVFVGQPGSTYRFYSIATDNVGHREEAPAQPDAQTEVFATVYLPLVMKGTP